MNCDKKYVYQNYRYTFEELEKHLQIKTYSIITGKEQSSLACNVHLLFLNALQEFKKINSDCYLQLQEILQLYEQAENPWFFKRASKTRLLIKITRYYIIILCGKDLVYISEIMLYHHHHYMHTYRP